MGQTTIMIVSHQIRKTLNHVDTLNEQEFPEQTFGIKKSFTTQKGKS